MITGVRLRKAISHKHPVLALKMNVVVVSGENDPYIDSIKLNLRFKM